MEPPFAHLNLRLNPFGQLAPEERASLAIVELGDLPEWLAAASAPRSGALARLYGGGIGGAADPPGAPQRQRGRAVEWIGPPGRGKSTHLAALARELPDAIELRPDEDGALSLPSSQVEVVLLDDAQRLSDRALAVLLSRAESIPPRPTPGRSSRRGAGTTRELPLTRRVARASVGLSIALAAHASRAALLRRAGFEVRTIAPPASDVALLGRIAAARIEAARRGEGPVPAVSPGTCARVLAAHRGDLHGALDALYDLLQELPRAGPL